MATMVCRGGLQPCVDSQFIEPTWPRLVKLLPPPPNFQFSFNSCFPDLDSPKSLHHCHDNQILLNVLPLPTKSEPKSPMATTKSEKSAYVVHPRSRSSTLSENSLALCTENLGNETGADFVNDASFSDLKIERSPIRKRVIKSSLIKSSHSNKRVFPPPLTTIAGADSIRVRSYREDGRLVMEAVKTPARLSYFHVERSNGRLRLSILKSSTVEEEEEEERSNDDVRVGGDEGNYEEDLGSKVKENGNCGGAEIEKEKIERPCKCNDAGENNNFEEVKNNTEMLLLTREPLISIRVSTS